jgi:hypothetical protein
MPALPDMPCILHPEPCVFGIPFELISISRFFIIQKAMKKMILASILTLLLAGATIIRSQDLQQERPVIQQKENADHRNGAPDMRHKKPLPLPLPPANTPDTTKQAVSDSPNQKK